jgi:type IX secretion system PorP/SprF family membrane protein
MKKIVLILFALLSWLSIFSQLNNLSDQYVFNALPINPAYAGSDEALSASLIYRNQWTGFTGAPKTLTAAIHSPLGKERVALGLTVVNDKIGVTSRTNIMANYAYRIEMGRGKLSFGIGVGASILDIGWDELKVTKFGDLDLPNSEHLSKPNFSAGVYYNSKKYFYGVSIPYFLSYTYSDSASTLDLQNHLSEYNYHIIGGYFFEINRNLKFSPSALIKYHVNNAFQVDISSQLIFSDRLCLGITYRSSDALAALMQLAITDQFRFAYSYDFDTGKTGNYHRSSHEVMLKFVLDYNARVVGPKRF